MMTDMDTREMSRIIIETPEYSQRKLNHSEEVVEAAVDLHSEQPCVPLAAPHQH
jgi:hypothetical protein